MDDKDVKEAALKQAQEAYGMFLSFMKWVAYIFIVLVIILAFFNFFDDPTGSKHLPEEISDQYDPSGLSKKYHLILVLPNIYSSGSEKLISDFLKNSDKISLNRLY